MVINPIVGVYIPIIRIPIKGGMTIPNIATFDHGTYNGVVKYVGRPYFSPFSKTGVSFSCSYMSLCILHATYFGSTWRSILVYLFQRLVSGSLFQPRYWHGTRGCLILTLWDIMITSNIPQNFKHVKTDPHFTCKISWQSIDIPLYSTNLDSLRHDHGNLRGPPPMQPLARKKGLIRPN